MKGEQVTEEGKRIGDAQRETDATVFAANIIFAFGVRQYTHLSPFLATYQRTGKC